MRTIATFIVVASVCFSCGNEQSTKQDSSSPDEGIQLENVSPEEGGNEYEILPQSIVNALYDSLDYIDVIFFNAEASMAVEERAAAIPFLANLSTTSPITTKNCQAQGRIGFIGNGKTIIDADFFFSPNCAFFIFLENNEYKYANMMTPQGAQYFKQMFQSVGL